MKNFIKWFIRISLGVLGFILLIYVISWFSFNSWRQDSFDALPGNSVVTETSKGPVEYMIEGESQNYTLLLHGTPGSYRTFGILPLLENDFSVISPSRPGYFRTPLSVGETAQEQADAYAALLDTLHIDSVIVIAYSGGGPSAIQFALRHPDKCSRLVLISVISQKMTNEDSFIQSLFSMEYGTWFVIKMMLSQSQDENFIPVAETYLQSDIFPPSETNSGRENDIYQFTHLEDYPLEQIQVPTIIIHGTNDEIIPISEAENLASKIPAARLLKQDGKDHFQVVFFEVESVYSQVASLLREPH